VAGEKVKTPLNPPSPGSGGQAAEENSSVIPRPSSFRRFLCRIVALIVGGLFIYAGAVKMLDPVAFARDIGNYQMLPWQIGVWLGLYLPWLEIFCGLALVTRILHRGGVFILTSLMSLFIVATIIARARGLDISCGCFGHASKYLSFAWHLVLDFLLLGGLVLLWKSFPLRTDARTS
jgi:putative oxidoreductase